jgi:ATP-binding cassette, subfamily C, bacterial CydC
MTTFGRLLRLARPHAGWLALGALLGFLAIGANVALMATSAYLIARAALVTNVADVALVITTVRVLAIARGAFRYLERYVSHRATFRLLTDLREWFYRSIEPLAPARLAGHRSGDLLARIVADVGTLEDFYVRVLLPPVVAALVTVFASLLLGAFDPLLGLVLFGFLTVTGVILPLVSRQLSRGPAADLVALRARLQASVVDEVQGIADLIVLDRAAAHRADTLALGEALDATQRWLATVRAGSAALAATFAALAGATVLAIGVGLVSDGRLDGVYLAVLPLVAIASFEVITPLSQAIGLVDSSEAAARRLFELIDAEPAVGDPEAPLPMPDHYGIEIGDLRFRYAPDEPLVLDGVSLAIPQGTSLAIVGPSGSGKSTLVNLLLRFWAYDEGEIRIGGHDLRDYRIDDVRSWLGVVSQDVHLFNATIRDNLAVADADVTDARIEAACRMARLHDFVMTLPAGYGTRVGEDGVLLSGGERQRLAIARAIVKDAPILILDEATANLDVLTERDLLDSIAPWMRQRTTLIVSHRSSVADRATKVIRMEAGRVSPLR